MKPAILFAVPGTSSVEAAGAFLNIDRKAEARFPGVTRQWAYTSAGIRKKLARAGREVADPPAALAQLRRRGATHVAVHSLHMVPGMEYNELKDTVAEAAVEAAFEDVSLGAPLLATRTWLPRTVEILRRHVPNDGEAGHAMIIVAHGSRRPEARQSLQAAADLCRGLAGCVRLGAIIPPPSLSDVVAECGREGVELVSLLPLTVAAGEASCRDIAGPHPGSWRSGLEAEGIACTALLKGLGEYDDIAALWIEQIAGMLRTFGWG